MTISNDNHNGRQLAQHAGLLDFAWWAGASWASQGCQTTIARYGGGGGGDNGVILVIVIVIVELLLLLLLLLVLLL